MAKPRILLLDIETAPNVAYVWGLWDQNIGINQIVSAGYVMCWAAKWYGERGLSFASVHGDTQAAMLEKAHDLIDQADIVVHYNGTRFDMPTLNKEFILAGMKPPAPYKQVDLLRTARQQFRFASNKLDYVAQALGVGCKVKHAGQGLWTACMAGDDAAWRKMERYNRGDVTLLEKVYDAMMPWIRSHPNHALWSEPGDTRPRCSNCGSTHVQRRGTAFTAARRYQRFQCMDCGGWLRGHQSERLPGVLHRDNG